LLKDNKKSDVVPVSGSASDQRRTTA